MSKWDGALSATITGTANKGRPKKSVGRMKIGLPLRSPRCEGGERPGARDGVGDHSPVHRIFSRTTLEPET